MHRLRFMVIAALVAVVFAPVTAQTTRTVTDSVGREVEIPINLDAIAPSGSLAQIVLFSVLPERIIGWANTPTPEMRDYLARRYWSLPTFGQFYGRNVSLNMEALIAADPDVIIDIGEAKRTIREDMDRIQQQTGIPVLFIEATLGTMAEAYRTLGSLTGETEAAEARARYVTRILGTAESAAASIPDGERVRVYYGEGVSGLETNPVGSIHADVIDIIGAENVADIPITSGGGRNQISMEQLYLWDPELIILGPDAEMDAVVADPLWRELEAVRDGKVYQVPVGPYNWMGRPPSINRIIGIAWLGSLVYPDRFNIDLEAEVKEFYRLFYDYELRSDQLAGLLEGAR